MFNLDNHIRHEQAALMRAHQARQKAAKVKQPETLDEAYQRIMNLKLKDAERDVVKLVFKHLNDGSLSRLKDGKLSKKEVFELYQVYQENEREAKRQYVLDNRPDNYWIIQDYEMLAKVDDMLSQEPLTSWDTETQGLDIFNHRIVGYSFYLPDSDVAVYIPFGHTTGQHQVSEQDALDVAKRYLENRNNRTIWHHAKYDMHMFLNHGIQVANPWWDSQVVAKILNEHESHRLKDLYAKYILKAPDKSIQFEDLFPDHKIYDKDVILSGIYAAGDAEKTYKLYKFQKPFIDTRDNLKTVWYQIEQKLLSVDLEMERTGFRIDQDRINMLLDKYEPQLQEAERQLLEAFNINEEFLSRMSEKLGREIDEFNVNSPEQLAYLLYDELGIDEDFGLKFKQKSRSTAAKVLDALCEDYEQLKPLLLYRQLNKLITTYLKKIPEAIEPATGRLHSRFNNMAGDDDNDGTATGRYSSSSYVSGKNSATGSVSKGCNLQNLPSKGTGAEVRKCFIPDDEWVFIGADLSQIEPRVIALILAERYGDRSMLEFYLAGRDLYQEMAVFTFGIDREFCADGAWYDPVTKTGGAKKPGVIVPSTAFFPRKLLKQGTLSFLYGSSAKSFARDMGVSIEIANSFFEKMIQAFPGLEKFRDDVIQKLRTRGNIAYASTLFGRKRRFHDYRNNYAELHRLNKIPRNKMSKEEQERRNELWRKCAYDERAAVNHTIQGTAADIIKQDMIEMYNFVTENSYRLHCSIHDEIIISVPKEHVTPELIEKIRSIMCDTVDLAVPLKTDIVLMTRWMDEIKPEDWDFEKHRPKEAA